MRTPNDRPRPIDRLRDGAGEARLPVGFGNIVAMFAAEPRLYLLAQRGVSSAVMADQIDPDRVNINIPQVVQREELSFGADTPFVQRTLCVAVELLNPSHLPVAFDKGRAFHIALSAAQDFAAVSDVVTELKAHGENVSARVERGEVRLAHLPRTPNLKGRSDQAIAHLRAVQLGVIELAELFYPKERPNLPWAASLNGALRRALSLDDPFLAYSEEGIAFLQRIANYRNAVIHPDDRKWARCSDYELSPDGTIVAPTIEIVHPDTPLERQDLVRFLEIQLDELSGLFETFLTVLCDRNVRVIADFVTSRVVALPEGELRGGSRFIWDTQIRDGFLGR